MTVVTMAWDYRRKYLKQSLRSDQSEGVIAFHNVRNVDIQFRMFWRAPV